MRGGVYLVVIWKVTVYTACGMCGFTYIFGHHNLDDLLCRWQTTCAGLTNTVIYFTSYSI
jgi:hypothetical protein